MYNNVTYCYLRVSFETCHRNVQKVEMYKNIHLCCTQRSIKLQEKLKKKSWNQPVYMQSCVKSRNEFINTQVQATHRAGDKDESEGTFLWKISDLIINY